MADNRDRGRKSGKSSKDKANKMQESRPLPPAPPIHDMLSRKLRAYYAEIASEPIPERFTALLATLEAQGLESTVPNKEADSEDR